MDRARNNRTTSHISTILAQLFSKLNENFLKKAKKREKMVYKKREKMVYIEDHTLCMINFIDCCLSSKGKAFFVSLLPSLCGHCLYTPCIFFSASRPF